MDFHLNFPQNRKEFILFISIISIISVNVIAPLITFFERGFKLSIWFDVLHVIPFIWITVIFFVLITLKPAKAITYLLIDKDDSCSAFSIVNILCSDFLMSIFLTIIGSWIGNRTISIDPIKYFFYKWPRNFAISFAVEFLIAQPIAHRTMLLLHNKSRK